MPACPACGTQTPSAADRCGDCGTAVAPVEAPDAVAAIDAVPADRAAGVARALWDVRGCEVSARETDDTAYLVAQCPDDTTELVHPGGPFTDADLARLERVREVNEFDYAYYVSVTDGGVEADVSDHDRVAVLDRDRVADLVAEAGATDRVRDLAVADGADDRTPDAVLEGDAGGDRYEAYPWTLVTDPQERPDMVYAFAYAVPAFLVGLVVSFTAVGAVFALLGAEIPDAVLLAAAAGCLVFGGWLGVRLAPKHDVDPVLVVDDEGITYSVQSETESVPWERVAEVYEETFTTQHYRLRFLTIEVEESDDDSASGRVGTALNWAEKLMFGNLADAHRVKLNGCTADFDEVAAAVRQYGDVPVESE